jgi:hypothetical protein
MSEASPQTTTGDPRITDTGQPNVGRGRRNNRFQKDHPGRQDNDEVPSLLQNYRYDICNNNPGETFERVTLEIAQYIATEVPGAGYMRRALIDLQEPQLLPPSKPRAPEEPPEDVTDDDELASYEEKNAEYEADLEVWKEEIKLVARRRMEQKTTILPSVYAVVWRQCTLQMKELVKHTDAFQEIDENNDVIALLRLIRASTVIDQRSQHPALSVLQALNSFVSFRQMDMRNEVYLEGFRDRVKIFEDISGTMIGCDNMRVAKEFGGPIEGVSANDPALVAAKKNCRDKFLAIAFLEHADKKRYSTLQTSMANDYLRKKIDEYPDNLVHASEILNKWKNIEFRGHNSSLSPVFLEQQENHIGRGKRGGRGGGKHIGSKSSQGNATNPSVPTCVPVAEILVVTAPLATIK